MAAAATEHTPTVAAALIAAVQQAIAVTALMAAITTASTAVVQQAAELTAAYSTTRTSWRRCPEQGLPL